MSKGVKKNPEKINWNCLSRNPNCMNVICGLDCDAMKKKIQPFAEELAMCINHPRNMTGEEFMKRQYELGYLELDEIQCEI